MNLSSSLKKIAIIPVYDNIADVIKVLAKFQDNIIEEICVVVDCSEEYSSYDYPDDCRYPAPV